MPSSKQRRTSLQVPSSYLLNALKLKKGQSRQGEVKVLGLEDKNALAQLLSKEAPGWKVKSPSYLERELFLIERESSPLWILMRKRPPGPFSHQGRLEESDVVWFQNQAGQILLQAKGMGLEKLTLEFHATEADAERGFLLGLELAAYHYKNLLKGKEFEGFPAIQMLKVAGAWEKAIVNDAILEGRAINLARHLVNLPPNELNPTTFSQFVKTQFAKSNLQVEVWDHRRLVKEGMGLMLGVGAGSPNPPCLVKLKYRPKIKNRHVAFVGKGITFDSGGLDIKPSLGMRLMKKDMGGSAAVMALAWYVSEKKLPLALDFYLALAENSVDGRAMRPSDVLKARSGTLVEIHNTDAEGRLVLADALDVAVTQKKSDDPEMVIDIATLTGAIKTALGTEIAGLFSNHDELADQLEKCGQQAGDLSWRMPLYSRYTSSFSSPFADMVNATDGWAGAITAALFLEKFVHQKPWAHFDIYAWNDRAVGAQSFAGGNGQGVPCLIEFLKEVSQAKKS